MATIFVIDDDEQLLRMVGLMLERGGHATRLINDPVEGLNRVIQEKPDMLVLDVMMPGMSGHDIARQLRSTEGLENLPILVLTARSQDVDRTTALRSGADDYLSKPVTSQELIDRVDQLLSQRMARPSTSKGTVIAIMGMRGGVGKTTLAVNLAAALRRASQQEVCLVEFTPSSGQAVAHLRMQARSDWSDLLTLDALNWDTLKNRLVIHSTGLRMLAAPKLPQLPSVLSQEMAKSALLLLRDNMAFTVVDLPAMFNPAVQATLGVADMTMYVITPDVVSVQTAVYFQEYLAKNSINVRQRTTILNQITASSPLSKSVVERGLKGKVAFQIDYDPNQAKALAQGVPLALTPSQSPLPLLVNRMAELIWQRLNQQA